MNKVYNTKVSNFSFDPTDEPILSVEVPQALLEDMDLKPNEVLQWTVDTDTRKVTIEKTHVIINK